MTGVQTCALPISDRHDEQSLVVEVFADGIEERRQDVCADEEPDDEEESELAHAVQHLCALDAFVDPKASVILKKIMKETCDNGGAIFFSTHVLDVAEKLCNKVAIIKDGSLIASGNMDEILKQGQSLESIFMEVVKDA